MNPTTDWFETEQVGPGTYRIAEGVGTFPCHAYLVVDGGESLLLDTGTGIGDVRAVAREIAGTVPPVVLTHSHWDHIGGAGAFDDVSIHRREQDDGRVSMDTLADDHDHLPAKFVGDLLADGNELPDGFDPDAYAIEPVSGVSPVSDGDAIDVGDRTLELIHVPGHSPGLLAVLDRTAGVCHGADVLEPGGTIFAQFAESDLADYRESVTRLCRYRDEGAFDVLTLGHDDPVRGDDLSVLADARTALEAIVDGRATPTVEEGLSGPVEKYAVAGVEVYAPAA